VHAQLDDPLERSRLLLADDTPAETVPYCERTERDFGAG
jgi:hypothetical protein